MPTALCDRLIEHWGLNQIYVGRACSLIGKGIAEVVWDPLCQDISHAYMKENISAHGSLRPRGHLCLGTARHDHSCFSTIADILTMEPWCTSALRRESDQLWDAVVITKATYSGKPLIMLLNWVPIRRYSLSASHGRTLRTVAILEGRIFVPSVCGHTLLESRAAIFWSRWDLENYAPR